MIKIENNIVEVDSQYGTNYDFAKNTFNRSTRMLSIS